jgi:glycerol-3-phosphate dehydrogenase subunit C
MTDGDARAVASSVRDVCEFVRDLTDDAPRRPLGRLDARVFYHPPCQLRGQRIGFPALELLRRVEGLEVVLSESACCGIGGTYGYNRQRHDISRAIARPLVRQVEEASPDLVVCDSETCRWHLQTMTGLRALHPMEVVLASLEGRRPWNRMVDQP